jgi:putative redox protein
MTVRLYATRKGWSVAEIVVQVRHVPSPKGHGRTSASAGDNRYTIEKRIEISGPVSEEQRTRMLEIAERCPVTQTLKAGVRFV